MKIPAEFEDILRGVELTEREKRFLRWITSWDDHTMQNMRTVVEKVRSTLSTLQAENASLRKERDAEGGEDYGPHVDRLAAYEETGLEPEDFKRAFSEDTILKLAGQALGITPDRLRELAQAHKENRVLPEGSGWFVTCSGKKLTVVMDIEAALRREQDG